MSKTMEEYITFLESRHSVRKYLNKPIDAETKNIIVNYINENNKKYNTKFEVFFDDDDAFKSVLGRVMFKNVTNYIILYHDDAMEAGYASVPIIFKLLELGFGTCYVGATYKKSNFENNGKTVQCAIAFGYSDNMGLPHKNKKINDLVEYKSDKKPPYTDYIIRAALSAPTAMNLQRFKLIVEEDDVNVVLSKDGAFAKFDLGIIKNYVDLTKAAYLIRNQQKEGLK